jgi:heme iron utilization protein
MTDDKPKTIRDTDEEARELARRLIATAPYAAIAVIDPVTLYPNSSRVLTGTDNVGIPIILVSGLSAHTKALAASPRCSLLVGEPGKGDPLAWPRLSLQCDAEAIPANHPDRNHLRTRFLRRHKKAALYADFPDFLFFRLRPISASLNGGFGKAYNLSAHDLAFTGERTPWSEAEENQKAAEFEAEVAARIKMGKLIPSTRVAGIDCDGLDLSTKGSLRRIKFGHAIENKGDISAVLDFPEITKT